MVPNRCPQTSFEACILRAILSVQLCGTWQSGQVARTPERLVKWIVPFSSSKTLVFISWQLTQNFSVLVASRTVLKPPQKNTPATNPPSVRKARLSVRAGEKACRIQSRSREWPRTRVTTVVMSATSPIGLGHRVHVGEPVLHQGRRSRLRDVAGKADVASRRHAAKEVAVTVLVVGDADHRRLALLGELARVAGQALVGIEIERVALDGVRDERGLVGVVAAPADVVGDLLLHRRRRRLARERLRTLETRGVAAGTADLLRPKRSRKQAGQRCGEREQDRPPHRTVPRAGAAAGAFSAAAAATTFTAHFLKSVCFEIGSVASSVTLLMSWLASKKGTKTTPGGILLRPRVSTRERISPRREAILTSCPRRSPRFAASSGCMNSTAPEKALYSSGTRRVMEPECQCSSTRPVTSQRSNASSGDSAGGSYGAAIRLAFLSGLP